MDIEQIKQKLAEELKTASRDNLEELRVRYLGRKGLLGELTAEIPKLAPEQRAVFGQQVNELKKSAQSLLEEKQKELASLATAGQELKQDAWLPGIAALPGHAHPLSALMEEICSLFISLGFRVVEGPEIESEANNFTGLNIPLDHPSRDAFDTFYLDIPPGQDGKMLLRSHTSPVQVRAMKGRKPPLAVIAPGRVYRPDAVDASHSFMFHQIEGFLVDKGITFAHLKGMLELFAKGIFGEDIKMRFRPHFFPFTEPSAEVDISCIICKGGHADHCSVCHGKGWLEILGSGMIHPNVLENVGYDSKVYTGFAFGMGVERIAMLKYGIDDIRLFFQNDLRFIRQF